MIKHPFIKKKFGVAIKYRITPAMAQFWLDYYNVGNVRAFRFGNIATMTEAIKQGQWDARNGVSIKFLFDGQIADGQNRLKAIAESGLAVNTMIVFGLKYESLKNMDNNIPRTAGQRYGSANQINQVESTKLNKYMTYARVIFRATHGAGERPTDQFLYDEVQKYMEAFEAVSITGLNKKARNSGFRAACAVYFSKKPYNAKEFLHAITGPMPEVSTTSAVYAIRHYFDIRTHGGGVGANVKDYFNTVAAIHAYERGEKVTGLVPLTSWKF